MLVDLITSISVNPFATMPSPPPALPLLTRPLCQTAIVSLQQGENYRWRKWKDSYDYIGVAELEAIVLACEDAIKQYPDVTLIIIITDSLCAKGWVERLFSDREDARQLLKRLQRILDGSATGTAIRLSCIYIPSANNLSDIPSREERELWNWCTADKWMNIPDVEARRQATDKLARLAVFQVCARAEVTGHLAVRHPRE